MKRLLMTLSAALLCFSSQAALAGTATGTLVQSKTTVALKYAYLVKGPDTFDNKKIIRKIILSGTDLGAKIQACTTMSCSDGDLTEGIAVDLVDGSRLNFWAVSKGGLVQHSGTHEMSVLKISADDAKHLAGKLSIDDSGIGGPKVDVDFDANFVKEFAKAR